MNDTLANAVLAWLARRAAPFLPPPAWAGPIILKLDQQETAVSNLSQKIAEVQAAADSAAERTKEAVARVEAAVADLESRAATPEDLAALEKIKEAIDAIAPAAPTAPTEPAEPTPAA